MTNKNVELAVILDRSGSMESGEKIIEARNSFNALIAEQRQIPGDVRVSLALFDDRYDLVYDRADLSEVPDLSADVCFPRGMTALLDAIGTTIDELGNKLAALPEDQRPGQVMIAIITDGLENASKVYSLEQVRGRITHQTEVYNWDVQFIGAGLEAMEQGHLLNVPMAACRQVSDDSKGLRAAYASVSRTLTAHRTGSGSVTGIVDSDTDNTTAMADGSAG
jgi:hypothetical protein